MKIIFIGTPDFAVNSLERLIKDGNDVCLVITQPDRRANRNRMIAPPVKVLASEHGIEIAQPQNINKDETLKEKMRSMEADIIIVAAYGQILKKDILNMPRMGCFNVHASLLPRFRGASPIQQAIIAGDKKTGVSIMKMEEGLDAGAVWKRLTTETGSKKYTELSKELSELGAVLLSEFISAMEDGNIKFYPQDDSKASYAPMITKKDGVLDFHEDPCRVERMMRAFDPWPGLSCRLGGYDVKLWKVNAVNAKHMCSESENVSTKDACSNVDATGTKPNGMILDTSNGVIDVSCGGGILRIEELQIPGKKRMSAQDFLRGHKL